MKVHWPHGACAGFVKAEGVKARTDGTPDRRFATDGRHTERGGGVEAVEAVAPITEAYRSQRAQGGPIADTQRMAATLPPRWALVMLRFNPRRLRERHRPGQALGPGRCAGGQVKFLYHQASRELAERILPEDRMLRGQGGLAGESILPLSKNRLRKRGQGGQERQGRKGWQR